MRKKGKKYKNKCQCMKCGDIIESKYRHDFVRCECGITFTDGGVDGYIRRGGFPKDIIEEIEDES